MQGIFWILDNGAKWKDLPREFGSKSTVHRWFQIWTQAGVFEQTMCDAGRVIEERDGYRVAAKTSDFDSSATADTVSAAP